MHRPPQVMPWGFPDPLKPLKNQDKAAFKQFLLEHHASLDLNSTRRLHPLTTIICTIGSSCMELETLEKMVEYGMKAVRVDFSTADTRMNLKIIRELKTLLQEVSARQKRVVPIAVCGEIRGPQIYTGKLLDKDQVFLKRNNVLTLTTHKGWKETGTEEKVYVDYEDLPFIVKPRDKIFLDFGRIELTVRGTVDWDIVCTVEKDGALGEHKLVTAINVPLGMEPLTDKDRQDLEMMAEEKVDALFAPAVQDKFAVREIRMALGDKGKGILVFSKIETLLAYQKVDEILEESDGLVINRGKLGIELSTEKAFLVQKNITAKAMKAGKPVFVVTEYLNSMMHRDCPMIAESTDVIANVIDGVDGVIMCEETAAGEDPALVVRTLQTLAREAEAQIWQWELFNSLDALTVPPLDPSQAVCVAAVTAANKCQAAAILVVTTSGRSAQVLARFRPRCPIIAITRYGAVARQLALWRGVHPLHYLAVADKCYSREVDLRLQFGIEVGKSREMIAPGDPLVLVNGWRQGSGFTNNIRLVHASLEDPWVLPRIPALPRVSPDQIVASLIREDFT